MIYGKRDTLFGIINGSILTVVASLCLIPFLHLFAKSISDEHAVMAGVVYLLPVEPHLRSMLYVLKNSLFAVSFKNTILVTATGSIGAILLTVLTAYPLSRVNFKYRKIIIVIYIATMLFNGGIIANYFLIRSLGLYDKIAALILPVMLVQFNMIVMKTFFEGLPEEVLESARIDGASEFLIAFRIVVPMSTAVIATVGLFYAVMYWNDFFHPLIYTRSEAMTTLQLYLYNVVSSAENIEEMNFEDASRLSTQGVQAATVFISTIPILLTYPYLQKYFTKGLTIGSVKG